MTTIIQKFGGTSMGTIESISQCVDIVERARRKTNVIVVVSALGGVTDQLLALIQTAQKGYTRKAQKMITALEQRHRETMNAFVHPTEEDAVWEEEFAPSFERLSIMITGISYCRDVSDRSTALIASLGERLSSRVMRLALQNRNLDSERINAVRLVRTDSIHTAANVDLKKTKMCTQRVLRPLLKKGVTPVVTGFIGRDRHGDLTLLGGRGGSDFTASIMGISTGADRIEIWTDVDGVMSADPRKVKNVVTWKTLDINVMSELSHGGAKVLHPKTITAAVDADIPVVVRNTFNSSAPGTKIVKKEEQKGVRGIAVDKGQVLYHFTEPGMLAGLGFIRKCAQTFEEHDVPLDVVAASEITLSLSTEAQYASRELLKDLEKIAQVEVIPNLAKVCIIGNEISADRALLAQVFAALKGSQIHAVSIGASSNNITLLVDEEHADAVLMQLHNSLFTR